MRTLVLCATLCLSAFGAWAQTPVVFSSTYSTSAAVTGGSDADAQFDSYPADPLPLITSSTVTGADYFASGSGIAAVGLLSTQAESDSAGVATAVGSSEFTGGFTGQDTLLQVGFSFDESSVVDPTAYGSTTMVLSLYRDGDVVSTELFSTVGDYTRTFATAIGGNYSLDLFVSSEADDLAGGDAFSSGTLTFQALAVPEPSSFALILVGLVAMGLGKARAHAWGGGVSPQGRARSAPSRRPRPPTLSIE